MSFKRKLQRDKVKLLLGKKDRKNKKSYKEQLRELWEEFQSEKYGEKEYRKILRANKKK